MEITPQDVQGRARATKLAQADPARAAEAAYAIRHPWYRCQALASAAEAEPNRTRALKLLEDAFQAAEEQDEINRVVTVASWPLVPCLRLSPGLAEEKVHMYLRMAANEPHTLRRADALLAILVAVKDVPSLKSQVIPEIAEAVAHGRGWRIERIIAGVASLIRNDYPQFLPGLLSAHRENRAKRKLLEELG
jgi:hypothetical protein